MPKALAAVTKALELDGALAEAHASLAYIKIHYDWDWSGAERECRQAINLNPDCANAYHWYSHLLVATGQIEKSLAVSEQCLLHGFISLQLTGICGFPKLLKLKSNEVLAKDSHG